MAEQAAQRSCAVCGDFWDLTGLNPAKPGLTSELVLAGARG